MNQVPLMIESATSIWDTDKMPSSVTSTQSSNSNSSYSKRSLSSHSLAGAGFVPNAATAASGQPNRATHKIRLSALRHNYSIISSAASRQHCSVIVVVKADGYGHGAIETALHLADNCGADAFAVATVGEGVVLRKALNQDKNGISGLSQFRPGSPSPSGSATFGMKASTGGKKTMGDLFLPPPTVEIGSRNNATMKSEIGSALNNHFSDTSSIGSAPVPTVKQQLHQQSKRRSPNIRILVLGPPTNLPDDFALYQQFNLELMCSGPKIARVLMEWVANCDSRRIQEVEEAANYQKSILMDQMLNQEKGGAPIVKKHASTLSNMEGAELGKEIKALLLNKDSLERTNPSKMIESNGSVNGDCITIPTTMTTKLSTNSNVSTSLNAAGAPLQSGTPNAVPFKGIEDAAKASRARELAIAKVLAQTTGEDDEEENQDGEESKSAWHGNDAADAAVVATVSSAAVKDAAEKVKSAAAMKKAVAPALARRKIRWHALVDSGMGRLGFKSVEDEEEQCKEDGAPEKVPAPLRAHSGSNLKLKGGTNQDTVSVIKDMIDAEIHGGAPIG